MGKRLWVVSRHELVKLEWLMAHEIGDLMKAICWQIQIDSTADFLNFGRFFKRAGF